MKLNKGEIICPECNGKGFMLTKTKIIPFTSYFKIGPDIPIYTSLDHTLEPNQGYHFDNPIIYIKEIQKLEEDKRIEIREVLLFFDNYSIGGYKLK
jgi:hypothetical protein